MTEPRSILIFRNGSIGNTLAATPAMRGLRTAFPQATITAVLDKTGAELLKHSRSIDEIIVYEKRGADRGITAHARLIRRLRQTRPTHAILFKRFFRNGLLSWLSGAEERLGFETAGRAPFLTRSILYDETRHVVDQNLSLIELLGAAATDRRYELELNEEDRHEAEDLLAKSGLAVNRFIVFHYGGSTSRPDFFPLERFKEILRLLAASQCSIVLIGAGGVESESASNLSGEVRECVPLINLPIRTLSALIERSRLFIGFNSGPAHIASAVGTPEIVFYRPDRDVENEIRKWKPVGENVRAMVPPANPARTDDWRGFLVDVASAATDIMRLTEKDS